jgi:hypothetical protein
MNQIYENSINRPVKGLTFADSPQIAVGVHDVCKIEPYLERGSEGYVTWFIVWIRLADGQAVEWKRVNSAFVCQLFYM